MSDNNVDEAEAMATLARLNAPNYSAIVPEKIITGNNLSGAASSSSSFSLSAAAASSASTVGPVSKPKPLCGRPIQRKLAFPFEDFEAMKGYLLSEKAKGAHCKIAANRECQICYQRAKSTALDCGHVMCLFCAEVFRLKGACGFCKVPVKATYKLIGI